MCKHTRILVKLLIQFQKRLRQLFHQFVFLFFGNALLHYIAIFYVLRDAYNFMGIAGNISWQNSLHTFL